MTIPSPSASAFSQIEPFSSFLEELQNSPEEFSYLASELSLITNAAIIYYQKDFSEYEELVSLLEEIRNTINEGLKVVLQKEKLPFLELYKKLGLQKLYKLGLSKK